MEYNETLEWLFKQLPMYQRDGKAAYKADLKNTLALDQYFNHPHQKFKSVHVAGTNGKGSVSHMIASVLQQAGYTVGLYTSPHLKDFRERIKINGQMIPKDNVVEFIAKYKDEFVNTGLSFFEMTVGMAFDYFRNEKVDIAVVETGMGGRLDSTNVLQPLVSVITNIGYDHMQFLGDTLDKIAGEKAAIIKPGIPAIVGETQEEIKEVFIRRAAEVNTKLRFADQAIKTRIKTPLIGLWQEKNLLSALAALEELRNAGFTIKHLHLEQGVDCVRENTGLRGRWEVLQTMPTAICDIAHNRDGMAAVMNMIAGTPHNKLHFVLGLVADKNVDPVLELLPKDALYYFCKADIPRGMEAKELQLKAYLKNLHGLSYDSVSEAYQSALKNSNNDDLVFVGGSTFVVAEIL